MLAKTILQLTPLTLYFGALVWFIIRVYRSPIEEKTARTEALGTKAFGVTAVSMTLVATILGPADTLALADQGRAYGFFFAIFPLLAALQHYTIGSYFAPKIKDESHDCITIGEIIRKRYTKTAQVLTGLATVFQALAFTGILCLAAGQILNAFFGMPTSAGIVSTALIVGFYTAMGGMNAVVDTDRLQFKILIGVGAAALILAVYVAFTTQEPAAAEWWWNPDPEKYNLKVIIATATAYFLGEALLPVYAVRGLISASGPVARSGFRRAAGFIAAWYLAMTFIGICSHFLDKHPGQTEHAFVNVLTLPWASAWIGALFGGLALVALFGLVHSTLDSVLNAGAVSLTRDILLPFVHLSDSEQRRYIKTSVVLIAVFGTIFSVVSTNLIDILIIGYTAWVPTLVFPFGYALVRKERIWASRSATVGILAGIAAYFISGPLGIPVVPPILIGFFANVIAFMVSEQVGERRERSNARFTHGKARP